MVRVRVRVRVRVSPTVLKETIMACKTPEVRGSPRQLPWQFPRTFNRSNIHGHPRPFAAVAVSLAVRVLGRSRGSCREC